jgi:hypothetical protein
MKKILFDVDSVIASPTRGNYKEAIAYEYAKKHINKAYDDGYYIILHTARYGDREKGNIHKMYNRGFDELKDWLYKNGIKYHEICMGKIVADIYVDDRAVKVDSTEGEQDWVNNFVPALQKINTRDKYNMPITEIDELEVKVANI